VRVEEEHREFAPLTRRRLSSLSFSLFLFLSLPALSN